AKTKVEVASNKPSGSILKGAIVSAVFAFVGALIWFGIAKATNREIGWVAWGVGIAAGFGMMIGSNGTSVSGGSVAAMMAVGGIMLGKWMVFSVVAMPMLNSILDREVGKISDQDILHVRMTNQQLEMKGIKPADATEAQRGTAGAEADKVIAKMDAKTKLAETQKTKASLKEFQDKFVANIDKTSLFFKTMFDPMDLLFFVI